MYNTINTINTINNNTNNNQLDIRRGDILFVDFDKMLNKESNFSFQIGSRPVLVLSNDKGNYYSPTITVAIITSKNKSKLPTHVQIKKEHGLKYDSIISTEQTFTIDKKMIIRKLGKCPKEIMERIEMAVMIQMGIFNLNKVNEIVNIINSIDDRAKDIGYDIEDANYRVRLISDLKMYCEQTNCNYVDLLNRRHIINKYKNAV